jgi:hypothetical protein
MVIETRFGTDRDTEADVVQAEHLGGTTWREEFFPFTEMSLALDADDPAARSDELGDVAMFGPASLGNTEAHRNVHGCRKLDERGDPGIVQSHKMLRVGGWIDRPSERHLREDR